MEIARQIQFMNLSLWVCRSLTMCDLIVIDEATEKVRPQDGTECPLKEVVKEIQQNIWDRSTVDCTLSL